MGAKRLAIIVGGGPAPGINGVISAATIEARNRGFTVFGICNGFTQLSQGDLSCVRELEVRDVSRIDALGGSIIGTSKTDPTRSAATLQTTIRALRELGLDYFVTIGGEGTATIALDLAREVGMSIALGHVPKTIDNDVPLPPNCCTFGFETAREEGAKIVRNLMVDARAAEMWYVAVTMGRHTGHLALGIGTAARAPLTIIPEELSNVSARVLTDIIVGAILKRLVSGRRDGVAVVAEGVAVKILEDLRDQLPELELDPQGNIRLSDLNLARLFSRHVERRLAALGISIPTAGVEVGWALRCADPNAYDREYTLQLGYGIVDLLARGESQVMITRQGDSLVGMPFSAMYDPATKMARVRHVDLSSVTYCAAGKFTLRLTAADLDDPRFLERAAALTNRSSAQLRAEFSPAVWHESTYDDSSEPLSPLAALE